jgi:hypothetical protein
MACMLLVGSYHFGWSIVVLPIWVLLVSIHILLSNLGGQHVDQ